MNWSVRDGKGVLCLVLLLVGGGCVQERPDIAYQGLQTIDELDSLEPSLAGDVDPEYFAPWIEHMGLRPLTPGERLVLDNQGQDLFFPDHHGRRQIESQFALFTQRLRPRLERWLERSENYLPLVQEIFTQAGLPQELAYLPFIESGYSPRALSHAGARGIWQFMPATGRRFGLACCKGTDERTNPLKSTLSAAAYLRELYLRFGDWSLALAAYNAGEGKIGRLVGKSGTKDFFQLTRINDTIAERHRLRRETLLYVPRFIAMVKIMENLDRLGFKQPAWLPKPRPMASSNPDVS